MQYDGSKNVERTKEALAFLQEEYGLQIVSESNCIQHHELGESILRIINYANTQLSIEFAISQDSHMIHFDIRKMIDGKAAEYGDEIYCVSREELMRLSNDRRLDDYKLTQSEYFTILVELLKAYLPLFLGENWLGDDLIAKKMEYQESVSLIHWYKPIIYPIMEAGNFVKIKKNTPSYIYYYSDTKHSLAFSNGKHKIAVSYYFDYREQEHALYVFVDGKFYKGASEGSYSEFLQINLQELVKELA